MFDVTDAPAQRDDGAGCQFRIAIDARGLAIPCGAPVASTHFAYCADHLGAFVTRDRVPGTPRGNFASTWTALRDRAQWAARS